MTGMAELHDSLGRAGSYASLRFATDVTDPTRSALMQRVQERATAIRTQLLFFELEWASLCDEHAEALLGDERLDFCRHYLRSERRYRPHLLSEPEEKILAEKSTTGSGAWERLFAEVTSAIEVETPVHDEGEMPRKVALDVALSNLFSPEREIRRATAEAVTAALEPGLRTRGFIFNTLLHDKAVTDRLRSYPNWLADRNLANEASDASVQALLEAVRKRYEIPRRWYRLKAELLGLERLADYDRMAAVTAEDASIGYGEARELVVDCYSSFSEELGSLVRQFFDEKWIDAPVRPGKRGGAFCASGVPSAHPYVMLNWTSRRRDVQLSIT